MPIDFNAILDENLGMELPPKMRRFLTPRKNPGAYGQSWGYYAFAFDRAFEIMAEDYCRRYPSQEYLLIPLMQLARHSMELALKHALNECTFFANAPLKTDGHSLIVLYDRLNDFLLEKGMIEGDDEWSIHVRKVIVHINKVDPTGEVFRYPTALGGDPFEAMDIDLKGLIEAHHHITSLADATVTMLQDVGNYPSERDWYSI
ncbi:hypothetical protein BJF92_00595 [Rhizobium rhizosphaerae]|uniref:HEPN domain-containing protein n=2 Tax=Rhizobiaceae TaxID=82115 RepID=A0A1Q9AEB5_9HYPH|nr:hypothetical protein BA939_16160 [Rhizobium sp. S41]KGE80265.1 hypothetical protein LW14_23975 [Rhizobium sp. H41]OLP53300.1 hypothetical protein BJF92_00595 [Xaviernesmea rhizosphaerae]